MRFSLRDMFVLASLTCMAAAIWACSGPVGFSLATAVLGFLVGIYGVVTKREMLLSAGVIIVVLAIMVAFEVTASQLR